MGKPMLILMTADRLAEPGVRMIREAGHQLRLLSSADPAAEMARIMAEEPVAALISRTLKVTAEQIASCKGLRIISRHGVGYDIVDLEAATARGIPVTIAEAANAQSVAELAIGLIFATARGIPAADAGIRSGGWDRSGAGAQLAGRRLGIVAYGAIGRAVARMAQGIGMRVGVFDPHAAPDGDVTAYDSLNALLAESDVLSLHAPLLPQTRGMIGAAELARLPKGAIVINTARGGLIDEGALATAIASGHLAGAGIDTFADEPLPQDHPFRALQQVVMTPHLGGSTRELLDSVAISAVRNVLDVLDGAGPDPRLVVNKAVLDTAKPEPTEKV